MTRGAECTAAGCVKPIQARNLCPMHYQRQRIHGSTEHTRQAETHAEMEARFWSKVRKSPSCWMWQASTNEAGYGTFSHRQRDYKAHRIAYALTFGEIPASKVIDHACHTPGCVNPAHLRLATTKQNAENRSGPNRTSKSGIRGVSLHRPSGKWKAAVGHNGARHAKYFGTEEEAATYVVALRQELFTHTIERKRA